MESNLLSKENSPKNLKVDNYIKYLINNVLKICIYKCYTIFIMFVNLNYFPETCNQKTKQKNQKT